MMCTEPERRSLQAARGQKLWFDSFGGSTAGLTQLVGLLVYRLGRSKALSTLEPVRGISNQLWQSSSWSTWPRDPPQAGETTVPSLPFFLLSASAYPAAYEK